jgi:hypothetical protein
MPKVPPADENSLIEKKTKIVSRVIDWVPANLDDEINTSDQKLVKEKDLHNDPD